MMSLRWRPGSKRERRSRHCLCLYHPFHNQKQGDCMKLTMVGFAATMALAAAGAGAAPPSCDRECLAGALNSYLQALVSHDPARMSVTRNVKYTENGVRLNLGDGLWQTAAALPTYRLDVLDDEAEQVGLLGRISENGNNNWFAVRLKVEPDHRISQIETLINRSISAGPGAGPPGGAQGQHRAASADGRGHSGRQAAEPRGPGTHRQQLFHRHGRREERRERAVFTRMPAARERLRDGEQYRGAPGLDVVAGLQVAVRYRLLGDRHEHRERRFAIVDRTKGLAFGWGYFDHDGTHAKFSRTLDHKEADVASTFRQPITFYIAEVFKVTDGRIRQIEAVLTTVPFRMESGW